MEPTATPVADSGGDFGAPPGASAPSTPFATGRYLVQGRRSADLSQRELARASGIPQSRIAALESGTSTMSVERLDLLFRAMGLRLAVVDHEGREITPSHPDLVRDNAGRRFPAHLDTAPPDEEPHEVVARPRYDRKAARAWYHHRPRRDEKRQGGTATPPRHLTEHELQIRALWRQRCGVTRLWTTDATAECVAECRCPDDCWVSPGCVPACGCRCEEPQPGLSTPWPHSA